MRSYWHRALQQVSILSEPRVTWRQVQPDGSPSRWWQVHLWTRLAPDQNHPEAECGLVSVQEAMFHASLHEVPEAFASRADPQLVASVQRLIALPMLPHLHRFLPRGSRLQLLACEWLPEGICFDLSLVGEPRNLSLNPLLLSLFPWREGEGTRRLFMPFSGPTSSVGSLLLSRLESQRWGDHGEEAVYAFELVSEHRLLLTPRTTSALLCRGRISCSSLIHSRRSLP